MEMVERLIADKAVVIFSETNCCMSHSIKTLISSFGANPTIYEVDGGHLPWDIDPHKLEEALISAAGPTVKSFPVVFIGQELVGGENQVMTLHVRGKLVPLLKKAGAIWI